MTIRLLHDPDGNSNRLILTNSFVHKIVRGLFKMIFRSGFPQFFWGSIIIFLFGSHVCMYVPHVWGRIRFSKQAERFLYKLDNSDRGPSFVFFEWDQSSK